jgi:hypothetical protein
VQVRDELTQQLTKGRRMSQKKRVAMEVEVEREVAHRMACAAGISRKRQEVGPEGRTHHHSTSTIQATFRQA